MHWSVLAQLQLLVGWVCGVCAGAVCDRAAKTSGGDDHLFGCDFLAGGNHADARFSVIEQGIHGAVCANFGAAVLLQPRVRLR